METDHSAAEVLLAQHRNDRTTVWFIEKPTEKPSAKWLGHEVFPSLTTAIHAVNDNLELFFSFDVIIHGQDGDRPVTQSELVMLVTLIRQRENNDSYRV